MDEPNLLSLVFEPRVPENPPLIVDELFVNVFVRTHDLDELQGSVPVPEVLRKAFEFLPGALNRALDRDEVAAEFGDANVLTLAVLHTYMQLMHFELFFEKIVWDTQLGHCIVFVTHPKF